MPIRHAIFGNLPSRAALATRGGGYERRAAGRRRFHDGGRNADGRSLLMATLGVVGIATVAIAESPFVAALEGAMDRMHEAMMAVDDQGNADLDFVRSM